MGSVGPARAQSATASIDGVVVDQSRAVLPGATIALVQTATGVERTIVADENGLFRAPLLPVGMYELTADAWRDSGVSSWRSPSRLDSHDPFVSRCA